jgi:UDP-N-acetylmuramoyl-tripeptide--D-alanyl-D-alanine ligase
MHRTVNPLTAAEIAEACNGVVAWGNPLRRARGISTDTRKLQPGQAFFALPGARFDGHDFLALADGCGAAVLVAERVPEDAIGSPQATLVLVSDTARALLDLATARRRYLRARVAAVTGSYGKSTVKQMLGAVLSREACCTIAPASYNNRIGVALTLLAASAEDDFVVLEMGANHTGEIAELAEAAGPELAVLTAIGEVHLEGFGDLRTVQAAKAEIIGHLPADGTLVLNADDALCMELAEGFPGNVRTFGHAADADVRPAALQRAEDGWQFEVGGWAFRVPSSARYDVVNACAAVCAAQVLGASPAAAAAGIRHLRKPPMRYERVELGGVTFVCDCYNSNPPALRAALESFAEEEVGGRRIVVCGDMLELGPRSEELHRECGATAAESGADALFAVGGMARHVVDGWRAAALTGINAYEFAAAEDAWEPLWWELQPGDAVLVKGSRGMHLETIVERVADFLGVKREGLAA